MKETFAISFPEIPLGYTLQSSIPRLTVPAGETGEVGVCLVPTNNQIESPGKALPFKVTVTGNNGSTQTTAAIFTTPDVVGITLEGAPTQNITTPSVTVNATLTVKSTGNVAAPNIPLALETSTGLTVSGLPATVSLGLGESKTFPLTLTPATNTVNQTLNATVTASFGKDLDGNLLKTSTAIGVNVRTPEVLTIQQSAQNAATANNPQLAQTLSNIAETTAQLQQKPDDQLLCERLTLQYDQLLQLADVNPGLASLKAQVQSLRDLAAHCNTSQLLTTAQQFFTNPITQLVITAPQIALEPVTVELETGEGTQLTLRLQNPSNQTVSLDLSIDALPTGVTAQLNRMQVTLVPGEILDKSSAHPVILTLSQSLTSTQVFPLRVIATLAGAPDVKLTTSSLIVVRSALADVLNVTVNPAVLEKGQASAAISARILNTANVAARFWPDWKYWTGRTR